MENKREKTPERISWRVHERDMCRLASAYRRGIAALVIALVLCAACAGYEAHLRHMELERWLTYLEQYDFESYDYTQDGQGLNIIGSRNGVDLNVSTSAGENPEETEPREGEGPGAEKGQVIGHEEEQEDEIQRISNG